MPDLWKASGFHPTVQALPDLFPGACLTGQDSWRRQSQLVTAFSTGSEGIIGNAYSGSLCFHWTTVRWRRRRTLSSVERLRTIVNLLFYK